MRTFCGRMAVLCGLTLLVGGLAAPLNAGDGFAADGYLSWDDDGECLLLREHDGRVRVLTGAVDGLDEEDHVRIWGNAVRGGECADSHGQAYEVTEVLTLWANDRHSETYYDHETDGSFRRWVARNRD